MIVLKWTYFCFLTLRFKNKASTQFLPKHLGTQSLNKLTTYDVFGVCDRKLSSYKS